MSNKALKIHFHCLCFELISGRARLCSFLRH